MKDESVLVHAEFGGQLFRLVVVIAAASATVTVHSLTSEQ